MLLTPATKYVVRRFCPPALLDVATGQPLLKKRWYRNAGFFWDGVYKDRHSVPATDRSYANENRIAEFVAAARRSKSLISSGRPLDDWHDALGVLAASPPADNSSINVVDFGGAAGSAYLHLVSTLRQKSVTYHVIDSDKMCGAARELFAADPHIQFHSAWPANDMAIDIVYASTVLPYVDDYADTLTQFAAGHPTYILLNQLAAGDFPTYAARQLNLPGQVLAYWFLNLPEVVDILATCGYRCVYEKQVGPEYDQSNYPERYRLGRMKTVLFVRT